MAIKTKDRGPHVSQLVNINGLPCFPVKVSSVCAQVSVSEKCEALLYMSPYISIAVVSRYKVKLKGQ